LSDTPLSTAKGWITVKKLIAMLVVLGVLSTTGLIGCGPGATTTKKTEKTEKKDGGSTEKTEKKEEMPPK